MFGSRSSFTFLAVWAGVIALVSLSAASAFASEKPEIFVQKGHSGEVKYLALSPDEELLLSISDWKGEDFISPAVRLWDVKSKRIFKDIKVKEKVMFFLDYQAGFSSDGRFVYFWGDDKQIFIYNIREDTYRKFDLTKYFSGSQLSRASGNFSADISDKSITIHLQPDDTDDDDVEVVKIVDASSGKLVTELKNKNQSIVRQKKKALLGRGISPLEVILSRDGSQFYSLEKEKENDAVLKKYLTKSNDQLTSAIRLRNMGSGGIPRRYALAFSDKRNAFFTGHRDGDLAEWDILPGRERARFGNNSSIENQIVIEKVFDDYLITFAKEKGWIIWDVVNGRMIKSSVVAMESDTFFTYVHERSTKIDENNKKTVLVRFEPGESADKRSRAERTDGTIKLIDTGTGKEMAEFISFEDGEWIVITPEGYFNASPNGARHLSVRVGNNVYSIDNVCEKFFDPVQVASVLQRKKGERTADIRKGILTPPDVTITSPGPNKEFSTDAITITVSAKDTGGGIDEIRLYHNGKAIGEDTRAVKIVPRGGEAIKTYAVTLVDGANTFRAVGFSKDRTESNPSELMLKLIAPQKEASLFVFAVGINKYKNPALDLNFAEPDAKGIAGFFRQKGTGLFKKVEIMESYNEQATKENITAKLKQLERTNPQDAVVLYFAGHGESISDKWYFIPHELTYPEREEDVRTKGVSSDELSGFIKNIKAQKILVLLDACKSGAILVAFRGFEDRKALSQLSRSTGVHIIAASTKDQFAAEVKDLGHGVFTYTLLEGLKGKAAGGGETVTVYKLKAYLDEQLPEITKKYKQEAQYPVGDTKGMDFPLVIGR